MQKIKEHLLLDAIAGENRRRPPVWFMRQAGRYLPSYRKLREKYSLKTLFFEPELAAEVTLMPVEQLGVDGAILFTDITVVALGLGLQLDFADGPKVTPLLKIDRIPFLSSQLENLEPIFDAIRYVLPHLKVPLIGFCGGPFTVATYFIEGGIDGAKKWAYQSPGTFQLLLDRIADISIAYLKRQVDMGVSVVQIFDTWASVLSLEQFRRFCLPYYQRIIEAVDAPVILFIRQGALYLDDLKELSCALSLDWHVSLSHIRQKTMQTLQGNLDPDLLFAPTDQIRSQAKALIDSMHGDLGFIAGLGHGIKPDVPVDAVIECVRALQGK